MTLPPTCALRSLKMNPPVRALKMLNRPDVGTAAMRANTEARVKNMDAKVNLSMVIKELWELGKEDEW